MTVTRPPLKADSRQRVIIPFARNDPAVTAATRPCPKPKLLDQLQEALRSRHYSPRTEHTYSKAKEIQDTNTRKSAAALPASPTVKLTYNFSLPHWHSDMFCRGSSAGHNRNQRQALIRGVNNALKRSSLHLHGLLRSPAGSCLHSASPLGSKKRKV